jgi:hypothetical protein
MTPTDTDNPSVQDESQSGKPTLREVMHAALKERGQQTLPALETVPTLSLRGFSYIPAELLMPALEAALAGCGCWVVDRNGTDAHATLEFELNLRDIYELYCDLISTGLEFSRDNHQRMTDLCTLRNHNPRKAKRRRVATIRLEVSFLEESEVELGIYGMGTA